LAVVVIAEKPSVGRDLARVLGAREKRDGYLEGNGYRVGWCVGHLLELAPPEAYDSAWKKWSVATLPMLPDTFQLQARKGAAKQLGVLRSLLRARDVTGVINACDAGREGELIFRYVWSHVFGGRHGPAVSRLWIASLTDAAIRAGFERLRPSATVDMLAAAAQCRSESDWLVGLNATRAMTLLGRRSGARDTLYSVGRVQTPTLAMITDREDAIESFQPEPFWQVDATFSCASNGGAVEEYVGRWHDGKIDRLDGPDGAGQAAAIKRAVEGGRGRVAAVTREEVRERAPALYDLTSLQKRANQRYGLSADRTLKAAQSLYEQHKAITYPRTDSRFLTSDMAPGLARLVEAQRAAPWREAVEAALRLGPRPQRKIIDDGEVGDHHALLPTEKIPDLGRLGADERRVYELVAHRFVAVFLPDAVFDKRTMSTVVGVHHFHTEGRSRVALGWHAIEPPPPAKDAPVLIPNLAVGDSPEVMKVEVRESKTQPPKRFSEATLLGAMEHAGKDLTEDELRRALKESGLGTAATRAAIIETLLTRDFIRRDGKVLVPTAQGRALIAALPVPSLRSAELTGAWEARLARMADGRDDPLKFMREIRHFTTEVVNAMATATPTAALETASHDSEVLGRCPVCGKGVTRGRRAYACASGRECAFVIFEKVAGKTISPALVKLLLARGRSSVLPGFRSKAGRRFKAALVLGSDGKVVLDFGQERAGSDAPDGEPRPAREKVPKAPPDSRPKCPKCKEGRVMVGRQAWGCTRWRDGCDFVVSFVHNGLHMPDDEADRLMRRGETRLMAGLSPEGRARLVLDLDAPGFVRVVRGKR